MHRFHVTLYRLGRPGALRDEVVQADSARAAFVETMTTYHGSAPTDVRVVDELSNADALIAFASTAPDCHGTHVGRADRVRASEVAA